MINSVISASQFIPTKCIVFNSFRFKLKTHHIKNFKTYISLAVVFFATCIFLTNCKKEAENNPISQVRTDKDQKMISQIETFRDKITVHLKSNEELTVDSAVWYLEAALNLTYARANNTRDVINIDSAKVTIPVTQYNTVSYLVLNQVYQNLVDSLSLHYHSLSGDRGLVVTDLTITGITSEEISVKMTDLITTTSGTGIFGFGPDDYWKWGQNMGKCDGTMQPWDASSQLARHANMDGSILPISCYTSVEKSSYIYPENVPTSGNPFGYGDYLLFEKGGLLPVIHQCLSPDAMNYYLDNLKTIANLYRPTGKSTAKYFCDYDVIVYEEYWIHVHYAQITYGIPISVSDPPEEL